MPTDFLTALNSGGSGINIRELAETLTEAEIAPRRELVTDRIDRAELQLSGYAQLRGQAQQVSEALRLISSLSPYAVSSGDSAIGVTVVDPAAVREGASSLAVTQLATAQVLNFQGFSDRSAPLGAGRLTVDFGAWSEDVPPVFTADAARGQQLDLTANATLDELAAALSSLDGVSAQVIDVGDGTFTLGVISDTGAQNALRFTVDPAADPALLAFDTSADPSPVQVQAAGNALLSLNGIEVTRASNQIDDLIDGLSLDLSEVTEAPVAITSRANIEGAVEVMQGFVEILNATERLVSSLTARGFAGDDEAGALAGDQIADRFIRQFNTALARGFGGTEGAAGTFLADLGILTERDGSFSLNETRLTAALTRDPAALAPLLTDTVVGDGATVTGVPLDAAAAGRFSFVRDPATGSARLGTTEVFGSEQPDGTWLYTVSSGPLRGISISVAADTRLAQVDYAPSMKSTLDGELAALLDSDGALSLRNDALSDAISDEEEALDALTRRAEDVEARYLARFTQMEQIITQLNATGAYLEDLMDAYNRDRP
ncbi:MAG: flagellar filament capping protein FliD [Pseudomonadota bacterium]